MCACMGGRMEPWNGRQASGEAARGGLQWSGGSHGLPLKVYVTEWPIEAASMAHTTGAIPAPVHTTFESNPPPAETDAGIGNLGTLGEHFQGTEMRQMKDVAHRQPQVW